MKSLKTLGELKSWTPIFLSGCALILIIGIILVVVGLIIRYNSKK